MMTINLEKELIRQNSKILTNQQELALKEYDKFEKVQNMDVLKRVGLNSVYESAVQSKHILSDIEKTLSGKDKTRVFHISQIEAICNKYYLRFLPSHYFCGSVDPDLSTKITTFEIAHGIKCNQYNSFIMAPKESFKLERKPKDPLFFVSLGNGMYYLVHKWGNDLNIIQRLKAVFSTIQSAVVIHLILLSASIYFIGLFGILFYVVGCSILALFSMLIVVISSSLNDTNKWIDMDDILPVMPGFKFLKSNDFDSSYL